MLEAAYETASAAVGPSQVVVVGFSQGACTALTWLSQTMSPVHRLLAWSGAHTPLPHASFSGCRGVHVFMSVAADDPWVQRTDFESSAARFVSAGAHVISKVVPGEDHRIHSPDMLALRHAVEQSLETR